ncbi:MAG: alpha/beta hydrolase [Alphaproteobacteria bacterium]|nr:alpha/beta hydrolase [Alphaproteobacteria bacterium]
MALDTDAARVMEMMRLAGGPPYETLTAPEARALFRASCEALSSAPQPVAEIRALSARHPAGRTVRMRLYRGATTSSGGALPALVYFHGGGWVIGDLDTHDCLCRHLANAARCIVVSVDYRLAPEHKFPAAVEDCLYATCWVAEQAKAIGIDRQRVAVGGDSAGGNLAAVVCLLARDLGEPKLVFQVLLYPATDCAMTYPSKQRFAEGYLLTRPTLQWFYDNYLRGPSDLGDWRASPLRAQHLTRLPAALLLTAGNDVLCDEGEAYARRLQQDGVPVLLRQFPDQIHGFLTMGKIVHAALPALDEVAAALRAAWEGQEFRN